MPRLTLHRRSNRWQVVYADPATGRRRAKLLSPDRAEAEAAFARFVAELPAPARRHPNPSRWSAAVTPEQFAAMLEAVPLVVGEVHADSWRAFLAALRSGQELAEAMKSPPTHELLTMSLANVQRVVREIGKRAGVVCGVRDLG